MEDKEITLAYYNQNAQQFIDGTKDVEFSATQNRFLNYLDQGSYLLDFGCGSGRDTKYFLEHGYQVDATDGSEELCKYATEYTGIVVKQMLFQELECKDRYDGVWACSSILHLPSKELVIVLDKIADALKDKGILYTSFKYGDKEGFRNGRYFTNMNEEGLDRILSISDRFKKKELWITGDVRQGRESERWLNVILEKK